MKKEMKPLKKTMLLPFDALIEPPKNEMKILNFYLYLTVFQFVLYVFDFRSLFTFKQHFCAICYLKVIRRMLLEFLLQNFSLTNISNTIAIKGVIANNIFVKFVQFQREI